MILSGIQAIQGGMGIGTSGWPLANLVARTDPRAMGVVSGTAIDQVMVAKLQLGDPGGHYRRALDAFPYTEVRDSILKRYFNPNGKAANRPFRRAPPITADPSVESQQLLVAANFAEVWLAKEGHNGTVGINHLTKIFMPLLPALYGAMLAGVDCVIMGAGIPNQVPGVLNLLSEHKDATYKFDVQGAPPKSEYRLHFSPQTILGDRNLQLQRPDFFLISSSLALYKTAATRWAVPPEGTVFEKENAGGHNANARPPKGSRDVLYDDKGQPIYGKRDEVDFAKVVELQEKLLKDKGLENPFWMAGGRGSPEGLQEALQLGAEGIQAGTAFALSQESGFDPAERAHVLDMILKGGVDVLTDSRVSPTSYPFKVAQVPGTLSDLKVYGQRERVCDLSYLVVPYLKANGTLGYRCASEPVVKYMGKGGKWADLLGRGCLCNGLMAAIGLGQIRGGKDNEPAIITLGDDVMGVRQFFPDPTDPAYSAADVVRIILDDAA